jgi:hypothetical protein
MIGRIARVRPDGRLYRDLLAGREVAAVGREDFQAIGWIETIIEKIATNSTGATRRVNIFA